ncbi:MAG: general secretion pathway protein GspK, partial [Elusimicrobia bacterium]|nr:general secretion pathway protein GspK [Elusimicrobiota bacterium]
MILIVALWTLLFLTVLAVSAGMGTRQKIILLGRLQDRAEVQGALEAGIKKGVSLLMDDLENNQFLYSPDGKQRRHHNPDELSGIRVGDVTVDVVCRQAFGAGGLVREIYGLCDEQGLLNINVADRLVLARLMALVLGIRDDEAQDLADNIVDWRDYGKRQQEGFFSDEYYSQLEHPYEMKETPFERIDELLLVKGITKGIYDALRPFVTVWGDGRVNINTVPGVVLQAFGLDPEVVEKILRAR